MTEDEFFERQLPVKVTGKKSQNDQQRMVFGGSLDKEYVCIDDDKLSFTHYKELYNPDAKKTPKDSRFFEYLFTRLRSENSSFRTYLGDLPKCKSAHIPKYINCFVKNIRESRRDEGVLGEVACPRIAELLGIDTVYNTVVEKTSPYFESSGYPEYMKILSVDGTPEGYRFADFNEVGIIFNFHSDSVESAMLRLEMRIRHIAKEYQLLMDAPIVKKFKEDFIKQYFFKNILCEDEDFWEANIGMLIGEDGDFCMAPMFDYEHMFAGRRPPSMYAEIVEQFFDYCKKYGYMHVAKELMDRLQEVHSQGKIDDILYNSVKVRPYAILNASDLINRNVQILNQAWKEVKSSERSM